MKFSVIIPVYNAGKTLEKCIDSVIGQSCGELEIILVDDGSRDGVSPEMCDKYAAAYPGVIKTLHKENGGAGDARNAGLKLAGGDYIFFLDCDDTVDEDTFEKLSAAIDEYAADVYYFGMKEIRGKNVKIVCQSAYTQNEIISTETVPEILRINPSACLGLWKRSLFEETGIKFRERGWGEDMCMTRKMLTQARSVVVLPECFYNYIISEGSVTSRKDPETNREMLFAMDDIIAWYKENNLFEKYYDELLRMAVDHVLIAASVRVLRLDTKAPLLEDIQKYMQEKFPDYKENPVCESLPAKHKLIISLLGKKHYKAIAMMFEIKEKL